MPGNGNSPWPPPLLITALLCGLTACSPDPAGQKPEPSAGVASAAAQSARAADADGDQALSARLVGTWLDAPTVDAMELQTVTRFAADGTFSLQVIAKGNPVATPPTTGTWFIKKGVLNYSAIVDGSRYRDSEEILRIDASELVYVDSQDKKTKIATRMTGTAAASASAPLPSLAPAQPAPRETLLADESLFVAAKDVTAFAFTVNETVQVRLIVEIDEKVPLNVVVLPGRVSGETYIMKLVALMLGQVVDAVGAGTGDKSPTEADLFTSRLSKRAAYGRFESPWVTLAPGPRTIVLDNSGELTPSRGDAPLRLRLYTRRVP